MTETVARQQPMMRCGHAANATDMAGRPVCVICFGSPDAVQVHTPADLTGRTATCHCGTEQPSSTSLAFFEYRGPGSHAATQCKHCHFYKTAHEHDPRRVSAEPHPLTRDHEYAPLVEGSATDAFYCGHGGWD